MNVRFLLLMCIFAHAVHAQVGGRVTVGTFAMRPASCIAGDLYMTSDTNLIYQCGPANAWTMVPNLNAANAFAGALNMGLLNVAADIGPTSASTWKYPCTTAGAKAAIADALALANGVTVPIVDARRCQTMTITSEIDWGNASGANLTAYFSNGSVWTVTGMTDGVSCAFKQFGHTDLRGEGGVNNPFMLHGGLASNNLSAIYCLGSSGNSIYYRADNIQIYNPNGATVANGAAYFNGADDNSNWSNFTVASYGTVGLNLNNLCCSSNFYNFTTQGNHVAGSVPLQIGNNDIGVSFFGTSADHPGAGLPAIKITGANDVVSFSGITYMESNNVDTTTPLIQVTEAGAGSAISFDTILSSPTDTNTAMIIQNTGTSSITVKQIRKIGTSSGTNCINEVGLGAQAPCDSISNVLTNYSNRQMTLTGTGNLNLFGPQIRMRDATGVEDYRTGADAFVTGQLGIGSVSNHPVSFHTNGVRRLNVAADGGIGFPELAAPSGNAGFDVCYGDSTAHALKCSYNNGTFFQIPQVIRATSAAFATATSAGTYVQNTIAVAGATTSMIATASPVSTPGVGATWSAYVSSSGNVTLNECAVTHRSGGNVAFTIRVTP